MANKEQVKLLKKGYEAWNKWRKENPKVKINLSKADFLSANLSRADLSKANLSGAGLVEANLIEVNLTKANLTGADLYKANFTSANLAYTNLAGVETGLTDFSYIDLSKTSGLENIYHHYQSNINIYTLQLSKGEIPEKFLRGCGLSDWEIESSKLYRPDLRNEEISSTVYKIFDLRANQAIQISPLFISYSHADTAFAEKLEPYLTKLGIRFWRDVHNATAGRLEKQIDHAMHQNPTVILILSASSIHSDWVEHEARLARDLEKELGRDVLCPIALDDSWKSAKWPARLMEQIKEYNILDYSKWNDDKDFEQIFNKMISGLDMFYKK